MMHIDKILKRAIQMAADQKINRKTLLVDNHLHR